MLSIVVMGGLGNQLFQVFTAIAYSMRNQLQLLLPRDKLDIQLSLIHISEPTRPY